MILIYVTHKNMEEARKVVNYLLEKGLIACANFFNMESSFRWKGSIETEKEVVTILKTKDKNWNEVKEEIKRIHTYQLPCIIKIEGNANKEFEEWVNLVAKK